MNLPKIMTLSALPDSLLQRMLDHSRSHDLVQNGKDSTPLTRLPERSVLARLTDWIEISTEELWFLQHTLNFRQVLRMSELSKFILLQSRDHILEKLVFAQKQTWKLEAELQTLQQIEDDFDFTHRERLNDVKLELGKFQAQTVVLQEALDAKNSPPHF